MARRFWPTRDPLRDRIIIGRGLGGKFQDEPPRQIIGIVGNARDTALNDTPRPILYVPLAQLPDAENAGITREQSFSWVVRTTADPRGLLPAIEEQLRQATGLPVTNVRTMDDVVSESTSRQRFNMELMTLFGGAALLLATVGIYGLMAYTVEQRRREIGIRMALGAEAAAVRAMVVRQGMTLVLAGLLAGVAAASILARLLDQFLFATAGEFAIAARDPLVFAAVPLVLAAVALLAIWTPARYASRIDPVEALRCE
jgi:ABC-type antimicrobial peptide transport system permease subunit